MRKNLENAVAELSRAVNIEDLELSAEGTTALSIDDVEIGITLLDDIGMVHLMAIIGDMPDATGPEIGQVLLSANRMAVMTGGASIGYDAEDNLITLNLCLPAATIDGTQLAAGLETVANVTTGWRGNLAVLRDIDAQVSPPPQRARKMNDTGTDWLRM